MSQASATGARLSGGSGLAVHPPPCCEEPGAPLWDVTFFLESLQVSSSPPTTQPSVITITGGPNATANIPGSYNDPADLYGILLGLLAIAVALIAARYLFGRGRRSARAGRSHES